MAVTARLQRELAASQASLCPVDRASAVTSGFGSHVRPHRRSRRPPGFGSHFGLRQSPYPRSEASDLRSCILARASVRSVPDNGAHSESRSRRIPSDLHERSRAHRTDSVPMPPLCAKPRRRRSTAMSYVSTHGPPPLLPGNRDIGFAGRQAPRHRRRRVMKRHAIARPAAGTEIGDRAEHPPPGRTLTSPS